MFGNVRWLYCKLHLYFSRGLCRLRYKSSQGRSLPVSILTTYSAYQKASDVSNGQKQGVNPDYWNFCFWVVAMLLFICFLSTGMLPAATKAPFDLLWCTDGQGLALPTASNLNSLLVQNQSYRYGKWMWSEYLICIPIPNTKHMTTQQSLQHWNCSTGGWQADLEYSLLLFTQINT